jgi:glutamyl-tRNA reductase
MKKLPRLTEEEQYRLEMMTRAIISKMLKDPIQYLKSNGSSNYAEMVREIFRLDEEK